MIVYPLVHFTSFTSLLSLLGSGLLYLSLEYLALHSWHKQSREDLCQYICTQKLHTFVFQTPTRCIQNGYYWWSQSILALQMRLDVRISAGLLEEGGMTKQHQTRQHHILTHLTLKENGKFIRQMNASFAFRLPGMREEEAVLIPWMLGWQLLLGQLMATKFSTPWITSEEAPGTYHSGW